MFKARVIKFSTSSQLENISENRSFINFQVFGAEANLGFILFKYSLAVSEVAFSKSNSSISTSCTSVPCVGV
jgi:hypothetical protein